MASYETNLAHINENRKKVYALTSTVQNNTKLEAFTRGITIENRVELTALYEAAFNTNRHLAEANTESIFRNRITLLRNLPTGNDPVKVNYVEASLNKARLDYDEHHALVNSKVNQISHRIAELNTQFIALLNDVTNVTAELVHHNEAEIKVNNELIAHGDSHIASASPESNAKLIAENTAKLEKLRHAAEENAKQNAANLARAKENKGKIHALHEVINKRRTEIEANTETVAKNSQAIAQKVEKL
jgi:outer membrane murein-binding lipoprotein Lpp